MDQAVEIVGLSDEAFERMIADPALIETHEQALAIMADLELIILSIQSQLDAAAIEAKVVELSPERMTWVRRASHACARNRRDQERVYRRDKEIRGTVAIGLIKKQTNPEEKMLRHQVTLAGHKEREQKRALELERLRAERERIAGERRKMAHTANFNHFFAQEAQRLLPTEQFEAIRSAADALTPTKRGE